MTRLRHPGLLLLTATMLAGACGKDASPAVPTPPPAAPAVEAPATPPPETLPPATPPPAPVRPPAPPPPPVAVLGEADHETALRDLVATVAAASSEPLAADEVGYYMDVLHARLQQVGLGRLILTRDADRLVVTLAGAGSFDVGSAQLTSDAQTTLGTLGSILAEYDRALVSIHGHTDTSGDAALNLRLSEQRAISVARSMLDRGVGKERLAAVGHGSRRPVAPNDTPEGRDRNRRVELVIHPLVRR